MATLRSLLAAGLAGFAIAAGSAFAGSAIPCSLSCPENLTVPEENGGGAEVGFAAPSLEGFGCESEFPEGTTISCDPPSGSTFTVGETTVECSTGESLNGRTFPCTFLVTVTVASDDRSDVIAPDCDEGDGADCAEGGSPDSDESRDDDDDA